MANSQKTLPAMRLGEIVLATGSYDAMKGWYRMVLDIEPSLEHVVPVTEVASWPLRPTRMCFYRMHDEHPYQDVVALFEMPGVAAAAKNVSGLHHMQLRNASISVLQERYRQLLAAVIVPYRAMDHGSSTSLYYRDPDQNAVELSASNFATDEEWQACLSSESYRSNPAGRVIELTTWQSQSAPLRV